MLSDKLFDRYGYERHTAGTCAAQDQYFRGSNKVGNGLFLSFFLYLAYSGQSSKVRTKKVFSIFDKTFFSEEFLMKNQYASGSTLIQYNARCYLTYFARYATMKTRTQEINFCHL
jgi:hypothetical protein